MAEQLNFIDFRTICDAFFGIVVNVGGTVKKKKMNN